MSPISSTPTLIPEIPRITAVGLAPLNHLQVSPFSRVGVWPRVPRTVVGLAPLENLGVPPTSRLCTRLFAPRTTTCPAPLQHLWVPPTSSPTTCIWAPRTAVGPAPLENLQTPPRRRQAAFPFIPRTTAPTPGGRPIAQRLSRLSASYDHPRCPASASRARRGTDGRRRSRRAWCADQCRRDPEEGCGGVLRRGLLRLVDHRDGAQGFAAAGSSSNVWFSAASYCQKNPGHVAKRK